MADSDRRFRSQILGRTPAHDSNPARLPARESPSPRAVRCRAPHARLCGAACRPAARRDPRCDQRSGFDPHCWGASHRHLALGQREPERAHRYEGAIHDHVPRRRRRLLHHRDGVGLFTKAVRGEANRRSGSASRGLAHVTCGDATRRSARGRQPRTHHTRRSHAGYRRQRTLCEQRQCRGGAGRRSGGDGGLAPRSAAGAGRRW